MFLNNAWNGTKIFVVYKFNFLYAARMFIPIGIKVKQQKIVQ